MSDLNDIARGLGIRDVQDAEQQLKAINEFVGGDILKLRTLERQLGSTDLGERRVDRVYRHVKLQQLISRT